MKYILKIIFIILIAYFVFIYKVFAQNANIYDIYIGRWEGYSENVPGNPSPYIVKFYAEGEQLVGGFSIPGASGWERILIEELDEKHMLFSMPDFDKRFAFDLYLQEDGSLVGTGDIGHPKFKLNYIFLEKVSDDVDAPP